MHYARLVPKDAPVAALLAGLGRAPAGLKVVAVLSGNINLDQLEGRRGN